MHFPQTSSTFLPHHQRHHLSALLHAIDTGPPTAKSSTDELQGQCPLSPCLQPRCHFSPDIQPTLFSPVLGLRKTGQTTVFSQPLPQASTAVIITCSVTNAGTRRISRSQPWPVARGLCCAVVRVYGLVAFLAAAARRDTGTTCKASFYSTTYTTLAPPYCTVLCVRTCVCTVRLSQVREICVKRQTVAEVQTCAGLFEVPGKQTPC